MNKKDFSDFSVYLRKKHYAHSTVCMYCDLLDRLGVNESISEPLQLFEHINKLLDGFSSQASKSTWHSARAAAGRYFEMVTGKAFAVFGKAPGTDASIEGILSEFLEYSTGFKHIKPSTAKAECSHLRLFLKVLSVESLQNLSAVTALDVRDYVIDSLSGLKASSVGRYITSLRNFFRFLEYRGISVDPSIFRLPLSSADWSNGTMPVTLSQEEESKLRAHKFRDDERGARNRAILMLMLDLGLRCAEIPGIQFSDIHWSKGTITVRGTKTHVFRELPLSVMAGGAIEDYVLNHRPHIPRGYLFLNIKPCYNHSPVTIGTVRSLIRYLYKCEGVSGWWKGTHAIRRTAASHIYNAGNGLKATADILGHESVSSATHYVKVDFAALAEMPQEWPGEVMA